jgi:hypothetical protein
VNLAGGDSEDVLMTSEGAMIVQPGVTVIGLQCIETGQDLVLDDDYALFHTGKPGDFVEQFVPVLRMAIEQVGWTRVRDSLKSYLNSLG